MKGKKRLHFGVIFSNLDNACQYDIWLGIVKYASRHDIHLTAYIGTYQTTENDFASHLDTCLEIIRDSDSLDGLIIFSGFIAGSIGNEEFGELVSRIERRIPLLSVSHATSDIPSVLVDNENGMYTAVEHLVQVHGKRQIAFVKGPEGHPEAEARLEGYKRALSANGIAYDERYIFPGNFSQVCGRDAVKSMLEVHDLPVDAIAACDDVTATGVLIELNNHGLLVPADIAVVGFDDDRDSATFSPSISTVQQDFNKLGEISAEALLDLVNGKPAEAVINITPGFITRQSCGCLEEEYLDTELISESCDAQIDALSSYVIPRFMHLFGDNVNRQQINEWVTGLIGAIEEKPFSRNNFLRLLNRDLISYSQYSKDFLLWNQALDILAMGVSLNSEMIDLPQSVHSAIIRATALVQEARFKEAKAREFSILDNTVMLRRVANNLVELFDIDSLVEELYRSLPELSITTALIGLYHSPIKSNDPNANRYIDTLIGFDGKESFKIKSSSKPMVFSDYSTIEEFDFEIKRRDLIFLPLFFKHEEYGAILMPFDPDTSINIYETLRANISTAIKGANLIKELEHQNALLADASKAKSEFLSTMSHEMRTPMNAIIGMTAIGKKATNMEEKNYSLNKIEGASSHLLNVINDVLDMAKIEANKLVLSPVEFSFDRMLQSVVTIINYRADEKEQKLSVNVDNDIPHFIVGDDKRLAQVLTNLLSNAVKFTPEGGTIRLDASLIEEIDGYCHLRIEVTDDGIGISHEQQENLFKAFEQAESGTSRKFGGTGLGLVISKNIVELMNGRIWVESELGKGAKFIFTVKVLSSKENPRSLLDASVNWENVRILVVDDMPETLNQFQNIFKELNVRCDVASDGNKACRLIDENGGYDIYFIDWNMPDIDGIELTRIIKSRKGGKASVATMISGVDWEHIKAEATEAGVDKHLMKPLFASAIIDCINECFGAPYGFKDTKEPDTGAFTGKKVLLAEDIEINREIFIALLADSGLDIECAENGKEALDMIEAAPDKYDIIFMDVQMPLMSGYEATRSIRALPALQGVKLPIVAMTANVFKSDIEESLAAGMDDHLGKPLDIDKVYQVLRKYL